MNPLMKKSNNPLINTALSLLRSKNPNGYQTIQNMMAQNINPDVVAKQMIGKLQPSQKSQLKDMARQYGIDIDSYLK